MTVRIGESGVQRPIFEYISLPVVLTKFVYATDPVNDIVLKISKL